MKVITTQELDLEPLALPFSYSFVTTQKRGEHIAWFTPSGKAKIWFGGLQTRKVGNIAPELEKKLHKEMIEAKADILWSGKAGKLYTTCGNITELPNAQEVIARLCTQWDARKDYEGWESL